MPVKLFLRKNRHESPFNHWLNRLVSAPMGDSVLLCSGYVQEDTSYSILTDNLLNSLKNGCSSGEITTVGYSESKQAPGKWRNNYANFINRLKSEGLIVNAYKPRLENWHAKVAVRLSDTSPVA